LLQKSVSLLHVMLNDLADLARLDAGHEQRVVAPFDAARLLSDFCLTMQPVADSKGLFLRCEGPESLPVEGDSAKVQRILQNLVLNALKYTQHGGIVVMWESRQESDAEGWMVSVQDTGPGFQGDLGLPMANQLRKATQGAHDVEDQARAKGTSTNQDEVAVTRVSQSAHHPLHQQAGEGIGLSIVKGLCNLLDATLELETRNGQGSTFRVTFPRHYNS
jgi:signal transduction histidine kinase